MRSRRFGWLTVGVGSADLSVLVNNTEKVIPRLVAYFADPLVISMITNPSSAAIFATAILFSVLTVTSGNKRFEIPFPAGCGCIYSTHTVWAAWMDGLDGCRFFSTGMDTFRNQDHDVFLIGR